MVPLPAASGARALPPDGDPTKVLQAPDGATDPDGADVTRSVGGTRSKRRRARQRRQVAWPTLTGSPVPADEQPHRSETAMGAAPRPVGSAAAPMRAPQPARVSILARDGGRAAKPAATYAGVVHKNRDAVQRGQASLPQLTPALRHVVEGSIQGLSPLAAPWFPAAPRSSVT
jgi:hypothetical protein